MLHTGNAGRILSSRLCPSVDRSQTPASIFWTVRCSQFRSELPASYILVGCKSLVDIYNRPDLTAERFIPDQFSGDPDARLYKTGDLTCFHPDGEIEYMGRLDFQVKIHGFRIELGDIETALNQHPDVYEAVVMAREEVSGNKKLVAYIVPEPPSQISVAELREFLKRSLAGIYDTFGFCCP